LQYKDKQMEERGDVSFDYIGDVGNYNPLNIISNCLITSIKFNDKHEKIIRRLLNVGLENLQHIPLQKTYLDLLKQMLQYDLLDENNIIRFKKISFYSQELYWFEFPLKSYIEIRITPWCPKHKTEFIIALGNLSKRLYVIEACDEKIDIFHHKQIVDMSVCAVNDSAVNDFIMSNLHYTIDDVKELENPNTSKSNSNCIIS